MLEMNFLLLLRQISPLFSTHSWPTYQILLLIETLSLRAYFRCQTIQTIKHKIAKPFPTWKPATASSESVITWVEFGSWVSAICSEDDCGVVCSNPGHIYHLATCLAGSQFTEKVQPKLLSVMIQVHRESCAQNKINLWLIASFILLVF